MFIDEEQKEKNKTRFLELLKSTQREGIKEVITFLENNDFFNLPSSLTRHHNWEGGLVQHCLGVYDRIKETAENLPEESLILTALLHDICKAGKIYKIKDGEWGEKAEDELEYPGHGKRSVDILEKNCGLKLNDSERQAIRWHMGGYNIPKDEIREFIASKNNNLKRLLINADRFDARHNGKV